MLPVCSEESRSVDSNVIIPSQTSAGIHCFHAPEDACNDETRFSLDNCDNAPPSLLERVIGSLAGDDHVVHVALAQAGTADPHEARLLLQFGDCLTPAVAHPGTQSANHLVDNHGYRTAVGNAAFNSFWNQFGDTVRVAIVEHGSCGRGIAGSALEITLAGTCSHRTQRAHSTIGLERASLIQDRLARAFVSAREK